jgi:hypothetical protein
MVMQPRQQDRMQHPKLCPELLTSRWALQRRRPPWPRRPQAHQGRWTRTACTTIRTIGKDSHDDLQMPNGGVRDVKVVLDPLYLQLLSILTAMRS